MKVIEIHKDFVKLTKIYKGRLVLWEILYYPIAYIKFMYYSLFNK